MYARLRLPFNASQACREFGSVRFVMRDALAALSVARTILLCARAIYVIMWTGHGVGYLRDISSR